MIYARILCIGLVLLLAACQTTEPIVKTLRVEIPVACQAPAVDELPADKVAALSADAKPAERIRAALADREAYRGYAQACEQKLRAIK
jgi:hypothetical protein